MSGPRPFRVGLFAFLVSVATAYSVQASTPEATPEPVSISMVAIGDSIPFAGFCVSCESAFVNDYAHRLEAAFGIEVEVTNRSRNDGAVLNQIADQVETEDLLREQLASADIIIISAGINDGPPWLDSHPCGGPTDFSARSSLDQMLTYTEECLDEAVAMREQDFRRLFDGVAAQASDSAQVVVINAFNWWTGWPDLNAVATPEELEQMTRLVAYFLSAWNAQECALAMEHGFICIDLFRAFGGPNGIEPAGQFLEADHAHPNAAGNALIADLLEALELKTDAEATPEA